MDPWGDKVAGGEEAARAKRFTKARLFKKITPTKPPPRPRRDELGSLLPTRRELAEFVGEVRSGLNIPQAHLAARAGVSQKRLVSLESGRPTVEVKKGICALEALGFD